MITLVGIILFLLSISAHEMGHAFAMKKYGYNIEEICILGFGPIILKFKLQKFFGNVPVTIRLFPFLGFVSCSKIATLRMRRAKFGNFVHIVGGGVIANVLYAAFLLTIAVIIAGNYSTLSLIVLGVLYLIGLFPKYTSYLVLPLGMLLLYVLLHQLLHISPHEITKAATSTAPNSSGGSVVTIAYDIHKNSDSILHMLWEVALISISIGLTNTLPFIPLDGGRMWMYICEKISWRNRKKIAHYYSIITVVPLIILLLFAFKNDIMLIIKNIF